jgi:hypothetical protein
VKVSIKKFDIPALEVKTKGIELDIYDNDGQHLGDLVVSGARLVWCKGKTTPAKGKKITWKDFIEYMESR